MVKEFGPIWKPTIKICIKLQKFVQKLTRSGGGTFGSLCACSACNGVAYV